jgi:hypothetical protein
MPLIKPEIQRVLRQAGLSDRPSPEESSDTSFSSKLDRAGLSTDEIAEELTVLAKSSGNESLRLRALESAMKAHGILKDIPQGAAPSFTVVIQSAPGAPTEGQDALNRILFPRVSLSSTPREVQPS